MFGVHIHVMPKEQRLLSNLCALGHTFVGLDLRPGVLFEAAVRSAGYTWPVPASVSQEVGFVASFCSERIWNCFFFVKSHRTNVHHYGQFCGPSPFLLLLPSHKCLEYWAGELPGSGAVCLWNLVSSFGSGWLLCCLRMCLCACPCACVCAYVSSKCDGLKTSCLPLENTGVIRQQHSLTWAL